MNKYIALDLETGGLDPKSAVVLTGYFSVLDENFNVTYELHLKTAPSDGFYKTTAEALEVNGINLVEHNKDPDTITEEAAGTKLFNFLKEVTENGKIKLVPIGHNVSLDISFITERLLSRNSWNQFVSYRILDTGVAAQLLKAAGILPETVGGGLGSLVNYYGVEQQTAHTCDGDTKMTVDVMKAMIRSLNYGEF